jgi:hypothetical protein
MLCRLIPVFTLCLLTFPAFCQSASKWQVATITEVKAHPAAEEDAFDPITYDVSVKVDDTIYLVRYTTPAGEIAPKNAAGRDLLVLVGKNTITYNDMLGRSLQVPIESTDPPQSLNTRNSSGDCRGNCVGCRRKISIWH